MRRIEGYTDLGEAVGRLLSSIRLAPDFEEIPVMDGYDRVLAEDVVSPRTIPPFDMSHVDGFAVRSVDTVGAAPSRPVKLKVKGVIGAGELPREPLERGETYRILTGGFLPRGADAVVPQEGVVVREGFAEILSRIPQGMNVDYAGRDVKEGSVMLRKGHKLKALDIGLLLKVGVERVKVYRAPMVGVLSVGSELTDDPDGAREDGKTLNTHRHTVERLVSAAGGEPMYLGIAGDDPAEISEKLGEGLRRCDMVLAIGGASVGDRDLVGGVLRNYRPEAMLQGLRVQPGRVGGFAVIRGKPVIMLPGHILSTVSAYTFLAYPILRMLQGLEPKPYSLRIRGRLASKIKHGRFLGFKRMVWVKVLERDGELWAEPRIGESSLYTIAVNSDAYILIPEKVEELPEGGQVDIYFVPGISRT